MATLVAGFDWARSPLGAFGEWPQSLKTMLRMALSTEHPIFIFWGEDLTCLYNDAYSRSLGPEKHPSILGKGARVAWPEIWDAISPQIELVMAGRGSTWNENHLVPIFRHGELQDVYWTYSFCPIDEPTAPTGVGGVLVIVSETTNQVRSQQQLQLATDAGEIGFWDVDMVHDRLEWPARVKAMFGISADQPVSMTDFYGGLHQDDRDRVRIAFEAALDASKRELYDVEYRTVGKEDGVVRWVAAKGRAIFDEQGTVRRVIGVAIDISRRKAVELKLRQLNDELEQKVASALAERRLLAEIVDGTDAFVQVADLDLRWLAINRSSADEFERIFGVRPTVGACMLDVLSGQPESRAAVEAVWRRALAGETFVETQAFGDVARDRRHYELRFQPLRNVQGALIGAYQFVYDVTERVRDQARLAEAEKALRQAQKMEAIGQLTGGIAHDFNNLLGAISSSVQVVKKRVSIGKLDGNERYLDMAERSVQRAASLTQRLLAFSRQQTLEPRPTDVNRLIGGLEELIRRTVGVAVSLEVVGAGGLWLTRIDPPQLESALLNLCINARDAMIPDGGRLTIETSNTWLDGPAAAQRDLPPGQYVAISVTDTGTGMTPEVIARAFDPFFTTKPTGQGTGLGLSMVYGFVRQSGGAMFASTRSWDKARRFRSTCLGTRARSTRKKMRRARRRVATAKASAC